MRQDSRERNPQQEDHGEMPFAIQEASLDTHVSDLAEANFKEVERDEDHMEALVQDQNIQKLNKMATLDEAQVKRPNIFAQKTRSTISTISRRSSNIFTKRRNVPLRMSRNSEYFGDNDEEAPTNKTS